MLSKKQISDLTALHQKKFRKQTGTFLAEGDKVVRDLLRSTFKVTAVYGTAEKLEEFGSLLNGLSVHPVNERDLEKISTLTTPQHILAVAAEPDLEVNMDYSGGLKFMLDGIKDPGNMGTLIRIADWFGINEVICSEDCVEVYNPKVIQAAMGSVFRVHVFTKNLTDLLEENKSDYHLPVYGTLLNGASIFSTPLSEHGYILLGNEAEGISTEIKKYITHAITIPGFSKAENGPDSLNVAISGGIVAAFFKAKGS